MDIKQLKLEAGMYNEAAQKGMSFGTWLESFWVEKGFEPTPYFGLSTGERMKVKADLKTQGKQPQLSAYELLLQANDIKAFGEVTDPVAKFFVNSSMTVLFPEFIANRIYAGLLRTSIVEKMIAEKITIQGFDYRKIYMEDTESQREASISSRGGVAPAADFTLGSKLVSLRKIIKSFLFDYEAIYNTPLGLYAFALKRVGDQIGISDSDYLIYTLLNGDGNSNGLEADQTVATVDSGSVSKKDIIGLTAALPSPYQLDVFVGKKAQMIKVWDALSDMTNPLPQWQATGLPLPVGYEWDRSILTSDLLLGVDSRRTCTYVTNDTVLLTETEKIIAKQQVLTVVSKRGTFDIIDQDGIGALDITH